VKTCTSTNYNEPSVTQLPQLCTVSLHFLSLYSFRLAYERLVWEGQARVRFKDYLSVNTWELCGSILGMQKNVHFINKFSQAETYLVVSPSGAF
jgi:hypothetical protein